MRLSFAKNCLAVLHMLMHAGDNRKKTDRMLELQLALSTQLDDLKAEKEKEKSAAQEDRAGKPPQ